jgi:flagellin FlaB
MGIGMMIIFISMVLVAAVSAAVIINTADDVSQQAQLTGENTIAEVATGFQVASVLGARDDSNSTTQSTGQYLEILVELHAGSPDITLEDVLIEITDGSNLATMSFNTDVDSANDDADAKHTFTNSTQFSAVALIDDDSTFVNGSANTGYVLNTGDVIRIFIDCSAFTLDENTDVSVRIIQRNGSPTLERFTTPDTYTSRYVELLG